jgi:hypothetical protein
MLDTCHVQGYSLGVFIFIVKNYYLELSLH